VNKGKKRYLKDEPGLFNDKELVMKSAKITEYTLPVFIRNSEYYECFISDTLMIFIKITDEIKSVNICLNHNTNKTTDGSGFKEFLLYKMNSKKNEVITALEFYEKGLGEISDKFMEFQGTLFSSITSVEKQSIINSINLKEAVQGTPTPVSVSIDKDDEPF
jgi:hypothetical protein